MKTLCSAAVVFFALTAGAQAANLVGDWQVSVNNPAGGTIDFAMNVAQSAVFITVVEQRESGDVNGSGMSPGPLVFWTDEAGSVFLGVANSPTQPSEISGLAVLNFEGILFSNWSAVRQAPATTARRR